MISPHIFKRTYQSGFQSEIILRPNFKQKFFGIIIDFGSSDPQSVPGSAHFLEHKLFSKNDGDLSHQFEELGADVNAFTSFNETMFYCSGVKNDIRLIKLIFRLVGEPYFTFQNIEQEKPIIEQELAMYQDEPDWVVNNHLMQEMFGDTNLGIDVAGTKASIAQITAEKLQVIYQKNYLANRMHFIACGDFSDYQRKNIFRLVNQLQQQYFHSDSTKVKSKNLLEGKMNNLAINSSSNSNLFGLGLRLKNFKKVLSSLDLAQILLEIMLESKLSVTSPWFEKMRKRELLNNSLQLSVNYTRQGNFATVFGISANSPVVIDEVKKQLLSPVKGEDRVFAQKFFELKKKEYLAQSIRSLNDLSYLAVECAEESLDDENSSKNLHHLQMMTFEDFLQYSTDLLKASEVCSVYLEKEK